jgi:preprotein translocase subunit SecB
MPKDTTNNGGEKAKQAGEAANQPEFAIQRIYTKDLSFESPNTPNVFRQTDWKPEIKVELNSNATKLETGTYEVVLGMTVTTQIQSKVAYLIEVKTAGIFTISNFDDEQLAHITGAVCPGIIFPFTRELICDAVVRGGFPQLLLAPINFDAVFMESQKQKKAQEEGKAN